MDASNGRESGPGSGVTARQAGAWLLVIATVALFVALFLPWWSLRELEFRTTPSTVVSTGFHSWGWLSVAAWVVTLVAVMKLVVVPRVSSGTASGRRLDNRLAAAVMVIAGAVELVGNVSFIVAAPKEEISVNTGQIPNIGIGVIIAMVSGVVIITGALLLVGRTNQGFLRRGQPTEVEKASTAARAGVSLLSLATGMLLISLFVPWWSWKVVGGLHPTFSESLNGFTSWGWLSFAVLVGLLGVNVWLFLVPRA